MFSQEQPIVLGREKKALKGRSNEFSSGFEFGERDGLYSADWAMADVLAQLKKRVSLYPFLCQPRRYRADMCHYFVCQLHQDA